MNAIYNYISKNYEYSSFIVFDMLFNPPLAFT